MPLDLKMCPRKGPRRASDTLPASHPSETSAITTATTICSETKHPPSSKPTWPSLVNKTNFESPTISKKVRPKPVDLDFEDLPDGSCFSRTLLSPSNNTADSLALANNVKKCQYIGSFPVAGCDQATRAEFVHSQLEQMWGTTRKKPVLFVISLSGVKICSPEGKSVYMAHALRRISYASCDPKHSQFSFLAREPKGHFSLQYCHAFLTENAQQAEELNALLGNAFRLAFAQQLQKQQATPFTELISHPPPPPPAGRQCASGDLVQREATCHSSGGLPAPSARQSASPLAVGHQSSDRSRASSSCSSNDGEALPAAIQTTTADTAGNEVVNGRNALTHSPFIATDLDAKRGLHKIWAKRLVGKTKHHDPVAERIMDVTDPVSSNRFNKDQQQLQMNGNVSLNGLPSKEMHCTERLAMLPPVTENNNSVSFPSARPPPRRLTLSPVSETSNSVNNESPTEANSMDHIIDKPPLIKSLEIVSSPLDTVDCNLSDISRPSAPNGYINESDSLDSQLLHRAKENGHTLASLALRKVCKHEFPVSRPVPTDEESLLGMSSDSSSQRSSRSSSGQSTRFFLDSLVSGDSSQGSGEFRRLRSSHSSSNGSVSPPPPPERHDSLHSRPLEEKELRGAPWFQAGIPREIALEVLAQEPVGAFMVRESTTKPGCYALSLRVPREFQPTGIAHYLILRTNRGYKIKGFTKEFSTLTALITHHSVMPELLPCPLSLSRYNPTFRKQDSCEDVVDIDEDPDYNLLSDFRKMMADLPSVL